jgi:hypothetical protein
MAKRQTTRRKTRKAQKAGSAGSKTAVTRYEYALLCVQLATVESQVTRHRTDLEIQLRRIAQLQDEVDALKKAQPAAVAPDSLVIALPTKASIES